MLRIALAVLLSVGASWAAGASVPTAPSRPPFMGAYIHIPAVLGDAKGETAGREAIARSLDRFQASGLHVVMPYATTTSGSALYASRIIPHRQYADWDPVAVFVGESRKRHLQVWPVVCVISCGDDKPEGILRQHPEWALRNAKGQAMGYLSPCNPQARRWIVSALAELVSKCQPDGILLDYLRFPSQPIQPDPESAARLEQENPGYASANPAEKKKMLQTFKERELTELAGMISAELRKLKPGLQIGLYTWGPQVAQAHAVAQNWPTWAARGYLDMVNVSGYCYAKNYGPDYLKVFERRLVDATRLMEQAKSSAQLTFTLGVKTSHGQITKAEEIQTYLEIARRVRMRGVAIFTWSYLQPFLDEVDRAGYLHHFETAAPSSKPS